MFWFIILCITDPLIAFGLVVLVAGLIAFLIKAEDNWRRK